MQHAVRLRYRLTPGSRDCMNLNIMMDPRNMYPELFHQSCWACRWTGRGWQNITLGLSAQPSITSLTLDSQKGSTLRMALLPLGP